jgi:hypothetical protein
MRLPRSRLRRHIDRHARSWRLVVVPGTTSLQDLETAR